MKKARWLAAICCGLACVAFLAGDLLAKDEADARPVRAKKVRAQKVPSGQDLKPINPGRGRGPARERSGPMAEENTRFRSIMTDLNEERNALRKEIWEAVSETRKGEGQPTREELKTIVSEYEGEATSLAKRIVDARITHQEKMLSILKSNRADAVEKTTRGLLMPRRGNQGRGAADRGRGRGPRASVDEDDETVPRGRGPGDRPRHRRRPAADEE